MTGLEKLQSTLAEATPGMWYVQLGSAVSPAINALVDRDDCRVVLIPTGAFRIEDLHAIVALRNAAPDLIAAKDAALERAEALLREAREQMPHKGPHSLAARIDAALTALRAARGK